MTNQDTANVTQSILTSLDEQGGNITIGIKMVNSLVSLLTNLTSTPNTNQKNIYNQCSNETLRFAIEFIEFFPGMENFDNNPNLLANVNNTRFFEVYRQFHEDMNKIINNPDLADSYYRNSSVPDLIAELPVLAAKASNESLNCNNFDFSCT